ncbi:MAG: hypothetical protein ACLR56_11810 [Oscillospiraceae bacterium]
MKDALGYEHLKNEIEELEAKTAAPARDDASSQDTAEDRQAQKHGRNMKALLLLR